MDVAGPGSRCKRVVVVKFGGSAVTQKDVYESLNGPALDITARQVAIALTNDPELALVGKKNIS